jgi:putative DNA primase/helicase
MPRTRPQPGGQPRVSRLSLTLNEVARRLNGGVSGQYINVRGPRHSAADRSLGIRFHPAAPDGFYVHSLAGDNQEECRAHVKLLIQKNVCDTWEPEHDPRQGVTARMERARALWQQGISPTGTLVEPYFNSRGCPIPGNDVIRFHPACPFRTLRVPTVLALITDAVTGEPIGVHRTALKDDGSGKRFGGDSKRMLGVARRGAVRLGAASDHLGIAEGVESALSAAQVFGTAVWATLSSWGIEGFPVVPGVKRLTIFADHDDAGITAARKCGQRYKMSGISGEIHIPPLVKSDWNDWLMERA